MATVAQSLTVTQVHPTMILIPTLTLTTVSPLTITMAQILRVDHIHDHHYDIPDDDPEPHHGSEHNPTLDTDLVPDTWTLTMAQH